MKIYLVQTESLKGETHQPKIEKGKLSDVESVFQIYSNCRNQLVKKGIFQWTNKYPTVLIVENDLKKKELFILKKASEIIGALVLNEEQDTQYRSIKWVFDNSKILVIHRLVVSPKHQKHGYAQQMLEFAEDFAKENKYSAIRLDVYSQNETAVQLYKKRNYFIRGQVNFPGRELGFYCMEKEV